MSDEWDGVERRKTLHVVDTSKALTEDELRELKNLAAYSKAARWIVAGMAAAAGFLGLDKLAGWFKP